MKKKKKYYFLKKIQEINQREIQKKINFFIYQKKKIDEEISTLKYQLDNLNKKSNKEIKESFYELLGLNQKLIYRKKMIGFNNLPFQMYNQKLQNK